MSISKSISLEAAFQKAEKLEETDLKAALKTYTEVSTIAQQYNNHLIQIKSLLKTCIIYLYHGTFYRALHLGGEALQLIHLHRPSDNELLVSAYLKLGAIYADGFKKKSIALNYFFKGIKLNVPRLNPLLHNNIGSIYNDLGDHKTAIKHLLIAKTTNNGNFITQSFTMENLGYAYLGNNELEKAEESWQEGLLLVKKTPIKTKNYLTGVISYKLANLYLQTAREEKAIALIEETLKNAKAQNTDSIYVQALKSKSTYALQIGDKALFLETINKAIHHGNEEMTLPQIDCLKVLKDFYVEEKEFESACKIADQIINVKAQIEEVTEQNSVAELLEKRTSEIMVLENKTRLISQQKEELEQFAHIVAHDLKEPVRNMGSYSSLLKRRYKDRLDEDGEEFLDFILNNAKHMYSMLEDLLSYVTLESGSDIITNTPEAIIDDIRYRLKDKIKASNTTILVETPLPSIAMRPVHFNLLIENLIHNAIKFRAANRPPQIQIRGIESEKDVSYQISDNGRGIDTIFHESIFQIFKRLDKKNYTGTGMGLSICKKIVEAYHGTIWVDSTLNEGSTFHFKIPK